MEYRNRGRGRMMAEHLRARQTTAQATNTPTKSPSKTPTIPQPTSFVALTTAFNPPSSCFENLLTMMPPPGYMIWANEPVPVANQTVAACYPPEFIQDYKSVSSGDVGSSVVPAMSPFVCPKNYCTMLAEAKNYIACCPSGYQFHPPETPIDPERPGYGGTCYSDFVPKTNYPVIAYDTDGETSSQVFSASTSGAQAYAHPMDGWALTSPSIIGCPTPSPSPTPTPSPSTSQSSTTSSQFPASLASDSIFDDPSTTSSKSMSTGAIAGAAVGGVVGLIALVALVWLALVWRRKNRPPPPPPKQHHQMPDDYGGGKPAEIYRYEVEGNYQGAELAALGRDEKNLPKTKHSHLNDGQGAFEMDAHTPAELPGGSAAKQKDLRVLSGFLDKMELARVTKMANWKQL